MIEQDTIRLLRECDAGVKMGVSSINDVIQYTDSDELTHLLEKCRAEHNKLDDEIQMHLKRFDDDGKEPNPMAKGMSHIKTTMKIAFEKSDETIADLITDGCNMGVKSLIKYLNEYKDTTWNGKVYQYSIEESLLDDIYNNAN